MPYKKIKWYRYRPGVAQKVCRGVALLFHDRGTRKVEWSAARPGRTLSPGKIRYPFYRRLGGFQGPVWTDGKFRPHRDSIPDLQAHSSVSIPTELPGPLINGVLTNFSVLVKADLIQGTLFVCNGVFCPCRSSHTETNNSLCSQAWEQWPLNSHKSSIICFYFGSFPEVVSYSHRTPSL